MIFYSNFIVEVITKIPQGRLTQCKMKCIKDLVGSKIFRMPLCRGILLPVFCMQIKDKLESKEEVSCDNCRGSVNANTRSCKYTKNNKTLCASSMKKKLSRAS